MTKPFSYEDAIAPAAPASAGFSYEDAIGEPKKPEKAPGLARGAADTAIAGATGLVSGVQMLSNVAGADNPVSRGLGKANEFLTDLESSYRKAEKQERAKKIKAAEESGSTWEEVKAYAGAFGEAPLDTTVNALGTSVPTLAAAFLTGGKSAAAQIAARALPAAMGAAQGAGAVKGQIYEAVEQEHLNAGKSPEEAAARAAEAQAYTGDNAAQIGLGAGLGVLAGTTGAEAAVRRLVGGTVAKEAGKEAAMGIGKAAGLGVLKETPVEMLQGGQERVASNLALQNEGFDTPTWQGVAGQAALEGLASAPMGAGFGMLDARGLPTVNPNTAAEPPAQPQAPAEQPPAPFISPDEPVAAEPPPVVTPSQAMGIDPNAGAISRVAAAAVDGPASMEMAAQQAEAAIAAEDNPEAGAPADQPVPIEDRPTDELRMALRNAQDPAIRKTIGEELQRRREAPATPDLFAPDQGAANVSNTDAAGALAAGVGGPVGADAAGSGPDAGLLAPATGQRPAGTAGTPAPDVQESVAAPVPGRDSDKALTKGPTQTKAKVKGLKDVIARNKAAKANVQDQPQVATPAAAPAPAEAVQAPQAVGSDGAAQPGAAPAGNPGVEAAGVSAPALAKREDGTLKNKSEYTADEWSAYTKSVIDAKLGQQAATPSPTTTEPTNGTQTSEAIPQETGREETALLSDSVKQPRTPAQRQADAVRVLKETGNSTDALMAMRGDGLDPDDDVIQVIKDAAKGFIPREKMKINKFLKDNTRQGKGGIYIISPRKFFDMLPEQFGQSIYLLRDAINAAESSRLKRDLSEPAPSAPAVAAPAPAAPATPGAALQSAMKTEDWTAEVDSPGNTIWVKRVGGEEYTARMTGTNSMEVTVLVNGVGTQIGSTATTDPKAAAKAASKAVADDVADSAAPASTPDPAVREKLMAIAKRLGVAVNTANGGFKAGGGAVDIPAEDAQVEGALSPNHVAAHELAHAAMQKRGMSFQGHPIGKIKQSFIPNWDALVEASKAFRPAVWASESLRIKNHARKPNEVIADAIGSVYLGQSDLSLLEPMMKGTGTTVFDLGLEDAPAPTQQAQAPAEPSVAPAPALQPTVAQATHQDPGEKPEAATKGVVNDSLKTAAKNEDTKPSEMRKWLLAEIDKELLQAPDRADYDEAVKRMGEKDAISMYTGNGFLGKNTETGFITFDVPGDGKFKVRNSVRGLLEFRKTVNSSLGFKDGGQKTLKPEQNDGVQGGSGGQMAAVTNMIEEGDFEAARDYAEAVGIKLEDVKVPRGERKPQWDQFLKDGTVPPPPNTAPMPEKKTAAQENAEKLQAEEDERRRPKDTGWNMAGTGYGGKRYTGRNITLADGREVVARIYENAGTYEEAEVKEGSKVLLRLTDRYRAQERVDAWLDRLMGKTPALDLMGFKMEPMDDDGSFRLLDGNMVVSVERTDTGLQARHRSAKSSPRLTDQQAVEWAANIRDESKKAQAAPAAQPAIPDGYKPAGEPFYRDGELTQGYAPFDLGQRVTMKESGGQSGVIDLFTSPDKNGVFDGAMVKFDNGVEQIVKLNKLEADAKPAAAQAETPKLTQAEAKELMEWQDLGQKDGIKTHILTFYESKADKDAKRGRMVVATVTKEADSKNWVVEGTDDRLAMLAMAKKKAEDAGMARAVADGFVEPAAAAPETPKKGLAGVRAKKAAEAEAQRAAYFNPGNIVKGYGGHDRVLEYTPVDERGTWSVRVQRVMPKDGKWVDAPNERPRWHSTQPEAKELAAGPVVKAPAAAQESPVPAAQPATVENFGEKLPPARRAMAAKLSETLSDDNIAKLPLSQIWPASENEAIEDTFAAAVAHVMREAIPAKPRTAYKVNSWVNKVKMLRDFAAKILRGTVTKDFFMEEMAKFSALRDLRSKIKLLEQIDREQWKRIGDVSEAPNAVRYEEGKPIPSPSVSVSVDGKNHWLRGSGDVLTHLDAIKTMLGTDAPESKMQFEIRQESRGERKVFINKKGDKEYRRLMEFATVDEARKAIREQYADLVAAWEGVKARDNITERDLRSDTNRERAGKDHRKGRDVTAEEFESKFGFRGGEFGKWVGQGKGAQERQFMLNSAYDALMDLSDLLGIPPKAISLEGSLGIAFGSRGSGWASAHFEPSNLVINLTKTRGAGALAHEWFHALDNYFARKRGGEVPFDGDNNTYRRNNYVTYKTTPLMVRKDGRGTPVSKERLAEWRKTSQNAGYLAEDQWMEDPNHKQGVRAEVEQAFSDLVKTLNDSPMLKRAQTLDGVGRNSESDGYWSRVIERAARAFENYVQTRMMEQGYHNDFLANVKVADEVGKNTDRYPYLLPSEITPVADAFKALFDTIQTKEDDAGNVVMFSRSVGATAQAVAQWQDNLRNAAANPQAKEPSMATPVVLREMGAKASRLVMPRTYLTAIMGKHPDVPAAVLTNLPAMLADPMFIIPHKDGGLRVFVQAATAKGEPIVAGVSIGPDGRIQTVTPFNDDGDKGAGIRRRDYQIALAFNRGEKIYAINKKALDESRASAEAAPGLIPLHRGSTSAASVITRADVVKKIEAAGGAAYSRATSEATGITNQAAEQITNTITARWKNAPEVVVVESVQDPRVPEAVRRADAAQRSQGATGEPEGFWYGGKAYIVSGALDRPADVARVLFHEVLGHYGLRGTFGDGLKPILAQIANMRKSEVQAKAAEYGLDMEKESDRLQAAEEVLAVMAQANPQAGFVKRAIGAIRAWLRENVPGLQNMRLTDNDIVTQMILPARRFVQQEPAGRVGNGVLAMSRGTTVAMPEKKAPGPQGDAQQGADTGKRVAEAKERTAIRDEAGKPLRLYHGSERSFVEFDIEEDQRGVGGIWFSDSKNYAYDMSRGGWDSRKRGAGGQIVHAFLDVRNPLEFDVLAEGVKLADDAGVERPTDSLQAQELLSGTYGWDSFVGELVADAKRAGHDALVIKNFNDARMVDSTAVVVFDQNSIAIERVEPNDPAAPVSGGARFSRGDNGRMTDTPAFRKWFGDSKVVDADGKPLMMYHGTSMDKDFFKFKVGARGAWFTSDTEVASDYAEQNDNQDVKYNPDTRKYEKRNHAGRVMPVYLKIEKPYKLTAAEAQRVNVQNYAKAQRELFAEIKAKGYDGILWNGNLNKEWVVLGGPEQIKSAIGNNGQFDPENPDIRFSRSPRELAGMATDQLNAALKSVTITSIKQAAGYKATDLMGIALGSLGRRQLVEIYGKDLPLDKYNELATQMEADKNEYGAEADNIATEWGKLKDEGALANIMHDATLAKIDPDKPLQPGDDQATYNALKMRFSLLSKEAKETYRKARDGYKRHHANVRKAIKERIERSQMSPERRAALIERMDSEFFAAMKGVYFPLARFGKYVVVVRGADGKVETVARSETMAEAAALRRNLVAGFPASKGYQVDKVILSREFVASRDAVGRGFMQELYQAMDKQDMDPAMRAEMEDTLGQLYLSSLPDVSWAKHGIHRKGTPGFSQDARRAFAQNMFHGARYLSKLRYSDLMQNELKAMQDHVDKIGNVLPDEDGFNGPRMQRVVDEFYKRHDSLMNPNSHPLSTALTSIGFMFHLGLSPASALVNLTQTAFVAYPVMAAKWGFGKAGVALLKASKQAAMGRNDITKFLNRDERRAYDEAVRAGTIDVTMAHDLAGIAQGEDAGVMWRIRPAMRAASFLFHHAERFNRQATFVAAYRLAREAGAAHEAAFEQATKATYDGHFDYSAGNRPRFMQGNAAKVILLFKSYAQNMVYTLARNAYQSVNSLDPKDRAEARKALAGILATHAMAAGVLGLPMVTTILAAISAAGSDDDEPFDAQVALQNMLADTFGQKPAEVITRGLSRLTPWDISGRVGLDRLIFPDVQEGLEGQRLAESAAFAALGPVAGIGLNILKGIQEIGDGHMLRGITTMMPAALRGPLNAVRLSEEGAQDKTGVPIVDEVDAAAVFGQALGFSPSVVRQATEGKRAVLSYDRALNERRQELMTQYARGAMKKDAEAMQEAREAIQAFNEKNPGRRITMMQLNQSIRNRERRIDQADNGVYLPKNRREAMDQGRFALSE